LRDKIAFINVKEVTINSNIQREQALLIQLTYSRRKFLSKKLFLCYMKVVKNLIVVLAGIFLAISCQKEYSVDTGIMPGVSATGTLKDSLGNCQPVTINGTVRVDSILRDTNNVVIQVNVTAPGSYNISTDVQNGYSFSDSGYFSTIGLQTVRLKGTGRAITATASDFTVTFNNSSCFFRITSTGTSGTGGGGTTPPPPPPVTLGDYFPITTNSNWSYALDVTGDTVLFTVVPNDVTISGNIYRPFRITSSGSSDSLFYRKGAGSYYEFGDIDFLGALDSIGGYIDYIFLKDNVPVNSTWETAEVNAKSGGVPGRAKLKFTIVGKDIRYTINGTQVDSIIKVQRELQFKSNGATAFTTVSTLFPYYAKGKGLLLIEGTLPPPLPPVPFKYEAKRYRVF
jgi:hypothetical protein